MEPPNDPSNSALREATKSYVKETATVAAATLENLKVNKLPSSKIVQKIIVTKNDPSTLKLEIKETVVKDAKAIIFKSPTEKKSESLTKIDKDKSETYFKTPTVPVQQSNELKLEEMKIEKSEDIVCDTSKVEVLKQEIKLSKIDNKSQTKSATLTKLADAEIVVKSLPATKVPVAAAISPKASAGMSDKIESISSEISLGFGEAINDFEDRSQTLVIREGPEPYSSILGTVCAYAILCSHGRIPIQKLKDHNGFWLPFVYVDENEKYSNSIGLLYEFFVNEFKNVDQCEKKTSTTPVSLANSSSKQNSCSSTSTGSKVDKKEATNFLTNVQLFDIYRLHIPDGQFISRYTFLAHWNKAESNVKCCKDTANIQWHSMESIIQDYKQGSSIHILDRIWGYEVVTCAAKLQQLHSGKLNHLKSPIIQEFTSSEVLKYISRNPSTPTNTRNSSSNLFVHHLHGAKFTEKDVIKIYCDFIQQCYPSMNMTYCSFSEYINKIGFLQFDENTLRNIFRAMCYKYRNFIFFNEFLMGLAALDSSAPNSQLRFIYIFRYYDVNSDGFLEEEDFRRMMCDIRDKANLSTDMNEVNKEIDLKLSTLKLLDDKRRISYSAFMREALNGHLSGTIHLFRTNKPILETIHTRHAFEYITNKSGKPFGPRLIGTCPKCRPKKYSLSYHTVKLNGQGRIDDPKPLIETNCGELDAEMQFKKKANEMQLKHSIEVVFNEGSVANKVLNIIRKMQDFNKLGREKQKEISVNVINQLTLDTIIQLCKEAGEIFVVEPRVLKVNTPCIVMGDLHGNINDLLTYEEQLWPLAPSANAPNVLFLGDYVDRGDYSIEVISYLFAMKILAPTKFFLLRGNHEIRAIQKNFTFARECMMKYNYQNGQKVFEAFNNAFDNLPLVGVIDESIFCAHGGIPFSVSKLEELYKIPMPMGDPEYQSKAAWEILWSDPITDEEYNQVCNFKNQSNENGFTDNLRRSTAYYFTEKALRNFLKSNNLSHVIRAHELEAEGYRFHHSGLLITVFSSSRYCNSNNKSASVFVDGRENDGFIKVIALDT